MTIDINNRISNGVISFLIKLIIIYQKFLSPDHSFWAKLRFPNGYCRYYPSCSEYTKQALVTRGLVKGTVVGFYRILRCNPFSLGGFDPVTRSVKQ